MTIQRIEHQRHESQGAGKTLRNVYCVAAMRGLSCYLDMKNGIEKMLANQRDAKLFGILGDHRLEPSELSVAIEKRPAVVRLSGVNLILKSHRMTKLIDRVGLTGHASQDKLAHPLQIAIEEVHVIAVDQ